MNKEKPTIEAEEKEKPKNTEIIESPEELKQKMIAGSEKEVDAFKREEQEGLALFEGGESLIDTEDKEALQRLDGEADTAKKELQLEISPAKFYNQGDAKSKIEKTNIVGITKDQNFEGSVIIKTSDKDGHVIGYAIRKNIQGDYEGNEIRYMEDGSIGATYRLYEADFSKLGEQGILELYENTPKMKERDVQNPRLLDSKEASRKFLAEERSKLAQEIREHRRTQRERLAVLKSDIEKVINSLESPGNKIEDRQYAHFSGTQGIEASLIAERFFSSELDRNELSDEYKNIQQLIDSSGALKLLKSKLEEHYLKASEIAQRKFEAIKKTVEQTMIRNNAFIVHTFLLDKRLRHNENSNVSQRATLEDDIDILLSLEPTISTSSVNPGSRQGLWNERIGVVLGGGDIRGIAQMDDGTLTNGIKGWRNGKNSSSKELDEKVSDRSERGYNELVVRNPEVFGFFQNVQINELNQLIGFQKTTSEQTNRKLRNDFMKYFELAASRGMSPLIMTPDRRLFEFVSIGDDGVISIGSEITPGQVAIGRAGLPNEKRKEIGGQIITKNLFRKIADQKEAKGIIAELSNQEKPEMELSKEEYLNYIKDEPGIYLGDLPENLRGDKEFLMEAAKYCHNPQDVYTHASDNLQRDVDFIKYIYKISGERRKFHALLYSRMPKDLRETDEMALLAIKNNDSSNNLEISLADSPNVWERIIDNLIEKKDPLNWSYLDIGETKEFDSDFAQFFMQENGRGIDMAKKILADGNFIQKLNDKYPNYKFGVNNREHVIVTRLA